MSLIILIEQKPRAFQYALASILLLLLALLAGTLILGVLPWLFHGQDDWRRQAAHELSAARGWVASVDEVESRKTILKSAPIWQQFYKNAEGMAVQDIVRRDVTSIFTSIGATGLNLEPMAGNVSAGVGGYGVNVSASLTADQLRKLLSELRSHTPYLRIQRMEVNAPPIVVHLDNPLLRVALDVFGYEQQASISANRGGT